MVRAFPQSSIQKKHPVAVRTASPSKTEANVAMVSKTASGNSGNVRHSEIQGEAALKGSFEVEKLL